MIMQPLLGWGSDVQNCKNLYSNRNGDETILDKNMDRDDNAENNQLQDMKNKNTQRLPIAGHYYYAAQIIYNNQLQVMWRGETIRWHTDCHGLYTAALAMDCTRYDILITSATDQLWRHRPRIIHNNQLKNNRRTNGLPRIVLGVVSDESYVALSATICTWHYRPLATNGMRLWVVWIA